jgi:hypothetical protein
MAYVKQNATSIYTDGLLRKYVNLGQQQKKQKKKHYNSITKCTFTSDCE